MVPEEPCQCPDCQRFYNEHDRFVRERPTLRQQQELNWAALQSFRTLASRVVDELQKQNDLKQKEFASEGSDTFRNEENILAEDLQQALTELENINAHLYSIEVLMEKVFDVKVPEIIEDKFRELAGELAPDPLNPDRIRLNRILHQTPDLPDKSET